MGCKIHLTIYNTVASDASKDTKLWNLLLSSQVVTWQWRLGNQHLCTDSHHKICVTDRHFSMPQQDLFSLPLAHFLPKGMTLKLICQRKFAQKYIEPEENLICSLLILQVQTGIYQSKRAFKKMNVYTTIKQD